jgi:3-methyladenine DNA glycosylase AlkD
VARPDLDLVRAIRRALEEGADPERAVGQQRYMRSALPYRGLTSPQLRATLRPLLAAYAPASRETWEATVRELWDRASFREEWYAAIALVRHRRARDWLDPASMPLLRHLVVTGAWWDVVDDVATHPLGDTLSGHRAEVTPLLRAWAVEDDVWLRRASIICQVGDGDATDVDLLRYAIEANLDDPTFWIRKAIGWALRDRARTDPDWVRGEVERHGDRLSGLSRREATKHLA